MARINVFSDPNKKTDYSMYYHGDNSEVIFTTSYLERYFTKEPYANFYFLASTDEGMTDYGIFFWKFIILPGFCRR